MDILNKSEFVEIIAARNGMTANQAEKFINSMEMLIYETLQHGAMFNWHGFGRFSAYQTKEANRINPATGEIIKIKSHLRPKFLPGKRFKEMLWKNK